MVENRIGWRELLSTIDEHQEVFNKELMRLKADKTVPDPEDPLLGPVIHYSEYVHMPICPTPCTEALNMQGARKALGTDHDGGLS